MLHIQIDVEHFSQKTSIFIITSVLHKREYLDMLPICRCVTNAPPPLCDSPSFRRQKMKRPTLRSATSPTSRRKRRPTSRQGTAPISPCLQWRLRSVDRGSPSPRLRKKGLREVAHGCYIATGGCDVHTVGSFSLILGGGVGHKLQEMLTLHLSLSRPS